MKKTLEAQPGYGTLSSYDDDCSIDNLFLRLDKLEEDLTDYTVIRKIEDAREMGRINAELKNESKEQDVRNAGILKDLTGAIRHSLKTREDFSTDDRVKIGGLLRDLEKAWKSQNTGDTIECVRQINTAIEKINRRQKIENDSMKQHKTNLLIGVFASIAGAAIYGLCANPIILKNGLYVVGGSFVASTSLKYIYDCCNTDITDREQRRFGERPEALERHR